jgi:phage terminase large subunit-like protein
VPAVRNWRKLPVGKLTRAEKAMAFAEKHLVVPEGALVGKPLKLARFQEDFFYAVFDNPAGTREAILSMGRKNAKTATIAIILLVFLDGPEAVENARYQSGALAKKQAAEVYNYAAKMAAMSPTLRTRIRAVPSSKRLVGLAMGTEYEALAAEGATAHGGSPLVAILDEAGQVKGPYNAFFEAICTSQGAYENPLRIWISTQGRTDGDLFNRLIDDAESAGDPTIVCHVYRAPEDCELDDPAAWQAANPALGLFKSTADMVVDAAKAARLPEAENTFRWLHLNQRVNPFTPLFSRSVWQANAAQPDDDAFRYGEVYGGLDLSQTTDLTAFVLAAWWQERWHIKPWFWMAEGLIADRAKEDKVPYDIWRKQGLIEATPGKVISLAWVAAKIAEVTKGIPNLRKIGFDRWRFDMLAAEFERTGVTLPFEPFGQGFASMSPAVEAMVSSVLQEQLCHGGHPVLNMCANNVVAKSDEAGNRKLDKARSTGRIDGIVALAMAMGVAAMNKQEPVTDSGFVFL